MNRVVTDQMRNEIRREVAICRLTTLLASYRTNDLEAFVDLLVRQHEAVQAECCAAERSLTSVFYSEE